MKILLINVNYEVGSTGKIVETLAQEYQKAGHEVFVIAGRHHKTKDNIIKGAFEWESKIHHLFSNILGNPYGGMPFSTKRIKNLADKINPDVVHLHCLNGYFVNIYNLLIHLKKTKRKVVLTNHADFMFTGGCGYALDCENWKKSQCSMCPLCIKNSNKNYLRMLEAFKDFPSLKITNVSPWLNSRSVISPILGKYPNKAILNPILEISGIKQDPFDHNFVNLVFVTSNHKEKEKGASYLEDLADKLPDSYRIFIISMRKIQDGYFKNKKIIAVPKLDSKEELFAYYKYADASLLLSKKETFSMVTAESLINGTPVYGFLAGGPESIGIDYACHFVKNGDVDALAALLLDLPNSKLDRQKLSKEAKAKFDPKEIATQYLRLFEEL